MRLKAVTVVILSIALAKTVSAELDDDLVWQTLISGKKDNETANLDDFDTENLDLLETELDSLNANVSQAEETAFDFESVGDSEILNLDLKHERESESTDQSSSEWFNHESPFTEDIIKSRDKKDKIRVDKKPALTKPKPGQTSLVIIFDGTGSMFDDLQQLQKGAREIISEITQRENNPIYNYVFVPFRDPSYGPILNTIDQDELLQALEELELIGGGDCPESSVAGINAALEIALPKSFVYVFTDATARDFKLADDTIKLIQKKQITLTFLLTGFCNGKNSEGYYVYERLAAISNGQVYNLQKTDIKDVLESIKQFLDANLVPVSYVYSKDAGSQNIVLDVGKSLKEFTVSLAGDKPNITVLDPNKEEYKDQKDVLDLENLKIVNVQDPQPGKWNVKTRSDSEHSLKLTALSDITFKFGFSTSLPNSIGDTEIIPIKNIDNFLAISTSNNSLLHNLTTAQIVLFNTNDDPDKGNLQVNLPLKKPNPTDCDNDSCLYVTKGFPPPLSLFKIYANGFDSDGNPLKYLLSTAIQAIDGELPRVFINESFVEVTEGDSVELSCKVVSRTPSSVQWTFQDKISDDTRTSMDSTDMNFRYELNDIKLEDAGKYVCHARNLHGVEKEEIFVIVKEKIIPLQIKMVDPNMLSTEFDFDYQISCYISPRQRADIVWYFNGEKIHADDLKTMNDNLVINRVNRNHSGYYMCVANNGRETKNATGHLNVFYEPEISAPSKEDLIIPFDEKVVLNCNASGNPQPTIVWHRENLSEIVYDTIEKFSPDDQGLYLCEASNGIGKAAWKEMHLDGTAKEPPKIVPPLSPVVELKPGDNLFLTCKCDQCEPVHHYRWARLEDPSADSTYQQEFIGIGPDRQYHTKSFQYDLEVKNLTASDGGYYMCEITNDHGMEKIITHVKILEKPSIEELIPKGVHEFSEGMLKIHKGRDIQVECKATGSPVPEIHWNKDGVGILPTPTVYTSGNSLILRNVSENDMGEYKCVASNPLGTAAKEVLLYVVVAPVFSSEKDTIITAEEGQTVQILCDVFALPFPELTWSFNDNELNLTDPHYQLIGSELSFEADYKDNGVYKCLAKNEAGEAFMASVLVVYVPPTIFPEEDDSVTVRVQHNITLKCSAEGYPIPEILWIFNDDEISNTTNSFILEKGDLILLNVNSSMAGPYVCEASNKIGVVQRTTLVTITEPPKVISNFESKINVTIDTSFSLMCAARGIPRPDVFWAKDGEKYTDGPQQQILDVTFGKIFSGNYTCIAQSPQGADTKNILILAIEPPKLIDIQSILRTKINVTEGETLEIKCPFINADRVTWFKDDFKFYGEPTNQTELLRLPVATLSDRGNYTCVAKNDAGSTNFTQEVKVLAPPRVISNDVMDKYGDASQYPEITVEAGEDLTVSCPTQGFPEPKIKWMKDSTVISNEPELVLKNLQPFDEGRYDCEARNALGTADYSYIIAVLAPPSTHLPKQNWKEVHVGEDLELDCAFMGNPVPKISWQKNDTPLDKVDSVLQLTNIQSKDKGTYSCLGTNGVGNDVIYYTVNVLESPKFTFINENVRIRDSDELMLRCAARGNPLPIVAWTYNGQMILGSSKIPINTKKPYGLLELDETGVPFSSAQSNDIAVSNNIKDIRKDNFYGKVYFDEDSVSLMLVIRNISRKLPGEYACHAINAMGNEQKNVNVQVLVSPYLQGRDIDKQPSINLTILGGLPVILFCPWYGVPVPTIEWLKNDERIENDYRVQISRDQHILTIATSQEGDSGEYHCRGINDAGYGEKKFKVEILAPPHFRLGNIIKNAIDDQSERLIDNSARHVNPGETITFDCPVSGNPQPAVFWLETTFRDTITTRVLPETNTQLILNDIIESATYTCYANNSLGEIDKKYEVLVLKTPEVKSFQPQQTVNEHRTITVNCPIVGGSPKPEISWFKNGEDVHEIPKNVFFSQDKTTLKILNAKKDDSGVYTCRGSNMAGQVEKDINVTVITPVSWSDWEPWTPCSQSCGIGMSTRKRQCSRLNGEPSTEDDPACVGRNFESKTCELSPCPINGGWGKWSSWTSCSKSCWDLKEKYKPTKKRYRDCNTPSPAMGGRSCLGSDYEEVECNTTPCTINGGWSSWTSWSPCSVSCGSGFATRYRECSNPVPLHGGQICIGSALESRVCYAGPCPIHGGWSEWSEWTECSQTCGTGFKKRKRSCASPEPRYGGLHCLGDNIEVAKCRIQRCRNSDLLRSLNQQQRPFKADTEPESKIIYNSKDSGEYHSEERGEPSYDYATGSSVHSTPIIFSYESTRSTEYEDTHEGTRVTVKMENLTPIDKDTAQISFHPGRAPIVVNKLIPCKLGFEIGENATCVDIDECKLVNACDSNQICSNTVGSHICSCLNGYAFDDKSGKCEDINECSSNAINLCSHGCKNTPGSFTCTCPSGQMLTLDSRSCSELEPLITVPPSDDYEMSDPAAGSLEFSSDCSEGYFKINGSCQDIDECQTSEDDCGIDQTCLNTKGSYLCIPTSCPEEYTRDEISRQCVHMCDMNKPCNEGAKVSQTLSYTLLTLDSIIPSEPFLKIVNYDINRIALPETKFSLENNTQPKLFRLETLPFRKGIAYLYGSNKIKKETLYNIKIKAFSYDQKTFDLLYVTKFVIYLYVM